MGLGGLITGIMGATGNSPQIDTPNIGQVGRDYGGLLQTSLNYQPQIYQDEATYQPLYTKLGLQNQTQTRTGNLADATRLAPGIMSVLRKYDPSVTGTLDTLGQQAQEQLKLNGNLDPATLRGVQQATRTAQAARGLGYGPSDVAQEQFYTSQTQEQRRAANQAFAGNVATQTANTYRDPISIMLGMSQPVSATPQIMSPQQTDSMLGTVYNARAAANIGNANNQTAMEQGFNSFY
jgi:hypothetical protein